MHMRRGGSTSVHACMRDTHLHARRLREACCSQRLLHQRGEAQSLERVVLGGKEVGVWGRRLLRVYGCSRGRQAEAT